MKESSMPLSKLDQKLVDYRIIELSSRTAKEIIKEVMFDHTKSCPVGKTLSTKLATLKGIGIAFGIIASTIAPLGVIIGVVAYFHIK
jgi:hypothetical protein